MAESKKRGLSTITFQNPPSVAAGASVVGKKEGEGPLKDCFDYVNKDTTFGEKTWEKAECRMQQEALSRVVAKLSLASSDIDFIFAGDLLNQSLASCYGLRESNLPFFGLFGACSTMALSMILGAMTIDGGFARRCACVTSSHFCTAERQFRFPLEYGGQRPPTSQWTVTGSGAVILDGEGTGPYIVNAAVGRIIDMGITDANNMGAAMAPAAYTTLLDFFCESGLSPAAFDLIVTGDLGSVGKSIVIEFMQKEGIDISPNYDDCGCLIFDPKKQDVHAGGSGCGCSASVLCGYILPAMQKGQFENVLFVGTGALLSPVAIQQGETIPSIAHLVHLKGQKP